MTKIIINPYNQASKSATAIRDYLRSIRQNCGKKSEDNDSFFSNWARNAAYLRHDKLLVVNWGNNLFNPGHGPEQGIIEQRDDNWLHTERTRHGGSPVRALKFLNTRVNVVTDKSLFFASFGVPGQDTDLPAYWRPAMSREQKEHLRQFLAAGGTVVERQKLRASGGDGIRILRRLEDFDNFATKALYVKYIKKAEEYRVHFGGTNVIAIQQKRLRQGELEREAPLVGATRFEIRNVSSGWVFCRQDVNIPAVCLEQVNRFIPTLNSMGIDFGAIDLIYNQRANRSFILEVNTAPGAEGQTVIDYGNYFKSVADTL